MSVWVALFVAGLVGSPHCVGMCGPFAAASARTPLQGAAWHLGRFGTYAALGAAAGGFGAVLAPVGWLLSLLAAALMVVFAASLAGLIPPVHLRLPGSSRLATEALRRPGPLGALALGSASGMLPCGLTYAALAVPLGLASPLSGALAMVVFGLGTVPLLAAATLGLRRVTATRPWARRALAALVLASGLWSLWRRAPGFDAEGADALADGPPVCHGS